MDFGERYRVIQTRDSRFDGRFFTAVRSTGIYCRPSCPARTPKESNVTFYPTSAAAHEAGYRACKRCLPSAAPGTPDWNLRGDLTGRAMRLITDGLVDRDGVPGLARALGYSERHLTRVLTEELGAGPLALARAHRAQTARVLLTTTALPMSEVAFASGFASVRQFNDTVLEVFALTPTRLREIARGGVAAEAGRLTLVLPARQPFDPTATFRWLAARAVAEVEVADDTSYARSLRLPRGTGIMRITEGSPGTLRLSASLGDVRDVPALVARVRRLFDLDADPVGIDAGLSRDPLMAEAVRRSPGIRLPGCVDPDEMLVRAVVGQQISVPAAQTELTRLASEHGSPLAKSPSDGDGPIDRLFPTAADLAAAGDPILRGPRAKSDSLRSLVTAIAAGDLTLTVGDDSIQQYAALTAFRGVGPWTAGYLAMRVLGAPDVLLDGDVALRTGARLLGFADDRRELIARAEALAPWRSYLSLHLWAASAPRLVAPLSPATQGS